MPERLRRPAPAPVAVALAAAATLGYAAAGVFRHDHFGSNAYDLGLFDQTVWGYSRFEVIPNTILRLPTALGDHFHPILVTLAPLYWIWDDVRVLLVAQAVLLAASSLPLFLWVRGRLGDLAALLFQAAYLAFWGLLGGNIFDFHEVAFAAPIVSLALYAALAERWTLLWAAVALGFLTREDLTLAFVGIGLFLLAERRWRIGAALIAASAAWFVLAVEVVIPALADRDYQQWYYSQLGDGPGAAAVHVLTNPVDTLRLLFTPREKLTALLNLLAPWLFLPLLSPLALVLLPTLAARFLSDKPSHWAPQGFHYTLVLAPMLAFAAADGVERLSRVAPLRSFAPVAAGAVLVAGLYFSFIRLKPLDELRRYTSERQIAAIETCLRGIPPDASVAATSALVPHLSHRRRIYVLDDRPVPSTGWYALDNSTWIFPLSKRDVSALIARKRAEGYVVRCGREDATVLSRGR